MIRSCTTGRVPAVSGNCACEPVAHPSTMVADHIVAQSARTACSTVRTGPVEHPHLPGPTMDAAHARDDERGRQALIRASRRQVPWLVIDGDCAFCTSSTTWIAARLHRDDRPNVRRVPYQFLDLDSFGLRLDRVRSEVVWLPASWQQPSRTITASQLPGGADALTMWLSYAGGGYRLLARLLSRGPIRSLAGVIYRVVAANRNRLPGGTPACAFESPTQDGTSNNPLT